MSARANEKTYAYYREILRGRVMPLAWVDLDLFDANIREVARRTGTKRLRIASKSIRSVDLMRRILASDPVYQGVMCYSGWEAVHLARSGFDDLMVAYPVWDEAQIAEVCSEVGRGAGISLMVDCVEHVKRLGVIAAGRNVTLPISIDLDMSSSFPGLHFGVRRSPLTSPGLLAPVLDEIERQTSLRLEGLMGYEAQIAGVQDAVSGAGLMNPLVRFLKSRSIPEVRERRARAVEEIERRGHRLRFVNGGGTGSLESTREEACVTETTAGSAFYSPVLFDGYQGFLHQPAAGFALEVVRRPGPGLFTCHGGGYVASGPAGPSRAPSIYLPKGARLLRNEGAGEVQTPIEYTGPERLGPGDPILFRHAKAGELCEHFNTLTLIQDGRVVGQARTYRGEGMCFLG